MVAQIDHRAGPVVRGRDAGCRRRDRSRSSAGRRRAAPAREGVCRRLGLGETGARGGARRRRPGVGGSWASAGPYLQPPFWLPTALSRVGSERSGLHDAAAAVRVPAHGDESRPSPAACSSGIGWCWRARRARRRSRRGGGRPPGGGSRATSPLRSGSPREADRRRRRAVESSRITDSETSP